MKNNFFSFCILSTLIATPLLFSSCKGCVKDVAKSITEMGISATEGIVEAIDENAERIGEKTTSAAGKLALGIGKSLNKQLEEHAANVFKAAGRTLVQSIDGLAGGITNELKSEYEPLTYRSELPKGCSVEYVGKYKLLPVIDSYIALPNSGSYTYQFTGYNKDKEVVISKLIDLIKEADDERKYTLIAIGLEGQDLLEYDKVEDILITIRENK